MTMKLHVLPPSAHSRKVMALISHLDLPVQVVMKELGTFGDDKTLLAMNPNGKLPTLEDANTYVWESNSILRYLAEQAGSALWPQDVALQRNVLQWQFWEASHFSQAVLTIYFNRVIKPLIGQKQDLALVEEKLGFTQRFCKVLDNQLSQHYFVVGSKPTIADFSIGAVAMTMEMSNIDISPYTHMQAWLKRLGELKGWNEATPSNETSLPLAA